MLHSYRKNCPFISLASFHRILSIPCCLKKKHDKLWSHTTAFPCNYTVYSDHWIRAYINTLLWLRTRGKSATHHYYGPGRDGMSRAPPYVRVNATPARSRDIVIQSSPGSRGVYVNARLTHKSQGSSASPPRGPARAVSLRLILFRRKGKPIPPKSPWRFRAVTSCPGV